MAKMPPEPAPMPFSRPTDAPPIARNNRASDIDRALLWLQLVLSIGLLVSVIADASSRILLWFAVPMLLAGLVRMALTTR